MPKIRSMPKPTPMKDLRIASRSSFVSDVAKIGVVLLLWALVSSFDYADQVQADCSSVTTKEVAR